jgi:nicotinamidase-related amidase
MLRLILKRQKLAVDSDGRRSWSAHTEKAALEEGETAVIIVDMWDRHWSKGATTRCAALAGKIDRAAGIARDRGILIVHAPSDVADFYEGTAARERALSVPLLKEYPKAAAVKDYPCPVDASDGGSDTGEPREQVDKIVWTRQTDRIYIDQNRDVIFGDEGEAVYSYLAAKGVQNLIYMGVHTNMCVLNRSFGIKKMLGYGIRPILAADLTDCMYNPERPPYVRHDEGTRLVVGYIEKFYAPTIGSGQI